MTNEAWTSDAAQLLRPPRSFAEVLGKANAVAGLRRRIERDAHSTGVILYGPAGVGKATLARIYAKAIQCEAPASDGSPCHRCETCLSVEAGASWGNIEVDAAKAQDERTAHALVEKIHCLSLADRRVITLLNADLFTPQAFDVLLKSIEDLEDDVAIIFTATDLKAVRLAGQSRCEIYRIRPLGLSEAAPYVRAYCAAKGIGCDDRVLDLIVAYGQGLPGLLGETCERVFGGGESTLASAQSALGLDWVEGMASAWRQVLANPHPLTADWGLPSEVSVGEQVRRVRVLLHYLYVQGLHQLPADNRLLDPALLHLDGNVLSDLVSAFRERAKRTSGGALWRELATIFLSSDHEGVHAPIVVTDPPVAA